MTKKASQFRRYARECIQLAKSAPPGEHRALFVQMAATWEELAKERERLATNEDRGKLDSQKKT